MKKVISNIVKVIIDKHLLILFFSLSFLTCKLGMAQCIDFGNLYASYTQCYTGTHTNPCLNPCSPIPSRHELITTPFMEYQTNNNVMIDQGYVKLGNESPGSEAEGIRYTFIVDPSCEFLKVDFVAILQDHGHARSDQAYFKIRILDSLMKEVYVDDKKDECLDFQLYPSRNYDYITMYQVPEISDDSKYTVSQILFNLHEQQNQRITVEFSTSDCNLNEHFGYAYFKAECINVDFNVTQTSFGWHVEAPDGYLGYLWDNGATTPATTFPITDSVFCCTINPEQPCPVRICKNRNNEIIDDGDELCDDPVHVTYTFKVCEDSSFYWHLMDTTVTVNRVMTMKFEKMNGSCLDTVFHLRLEPNLRFYNIYDVQVCLGDTGFHEMGFDIDSLYLNMPPDTLFGRSQVFDCDSNTVLHLTVIPPLNPGYIECNDTIICEKVSQRYKVVDPPDSTNTHVNYHWIRPPKVTGSEYGRTVSLTIDTGAINPVVIQVARTTVCDTDTLSITIYHNPPYREDYYDTIKVGHEYNGYGFHIPPSYSVGTVPYSHSYTSIHGCDSSFHLHLTRYKPLTVNIRPIPFEICEGDSAVLYATGEFSDLESVACPPRPVNIGDFLCTDETTCSPGELGDRTPVAVVFYVNYSGWHGSAVSLYAPSDEMWGRDGIGLSQDIISLTNYAESAPLAAIQDVDGSRNTYLIRSSGNAIAYPAAYVLSAQAGWYFPALGQLCQLLHNSYIVNQSLLQVGGDLLGSGQYWSSTEGPIDTYEAKSRAWYMDKDTGTLNIDTKEKYKKIRSIRDF